MSLKKRKNIKNSDRAIIYLRYILPIILSLAMLIPMSIECLQYSTVESTNTAISSFELFENSWEKVRNYLFSGGDTKPDQEQFAWIMLAWLIGTAILYVLGLVSTVAVSFFALRYVNEPKDNDAGRLMFITVVPNRIVVLILQALTLPLLFLSRIVIPMYDVMNVDVLLNVSFAEPWIFGLAVLAVSIALSIISAIIEKRQGLDVFKKRIVEKLGTEEEELDRTDDEDDYTPMFQSYNNLRRKELRAEENEKIRSFIKRDENNKD